MVDKQPYCLLFPDGGSVCNNIHLQAGSDQATTNTNFDIMLLEGNCAKSPQYKLTICCNCDQ